MIGEAQSPTRKDARPASPSVAAFARASAAASASRSIPTPKDAGNSLSAASSRQPVPVHDARGMNNPCSPYHTAIELIGRRWTGALIMVLMDGPQRFSQLAAAVPGVSDRLLSERLKELEARGIVRRTVEPGPPVGVSYELTAMGADLRPALSELQAWARRWLES